MKSINYRIKSKVALNLLLCFVSILYFFPMYFFINNAFKKDEFIHQEPLYLRLSTFTFKNITEAFELINYPRTLLNSMTILIIACTLLIAAGSLAAFGIVMSKSKFMNHLYVFLVMLITLPFQVAMIPLIFLLRQMGLNNSFLGTSLVYAAQGLPFAIFIYTGYIRTLPKQLAEAATVDGCSLFKTYLFIYMPLLKIVTVTVIILRGLFIWNDLLIPLITITRGKMQTLPLMIYQFSQDNLIRWDMMFGATLLASAPILVLFLAFQNVFVKGIVAGSVKG